MQSTDGPILDMTPTGDFTWQGSTKPSFGAIVVRLAIFTVLLGFGALVFWLAVFTVPILILAGLAIYAYVRFKMSRGGLRFRPVVVRTARQ